MIVCVQQVEEVNNPLQFTYTPWPPSLPPLRRGGKANFALPEKKKNQNENRMLLLEVNIFFSLTLLENTSFLENTTFSFTSSEIFTHDKYM